MYKIFPPVKEINILKDEFCNVENLGYESYNCELDVDLLKSLPEEYKPSDKLKSNKFQYARGKTIEYNREIQDQGYVIIIENDGILVKAADAQGFHYGMDTFRQVLKNEVNGMINCLEIYDYPILKKRGLMLDISRGKVYTLEYLLNLVEILKSLRFNVLQLYIEHTFDFKSHPVISKGSSPITAEDILKLQSKCEEYGIELQANLQSLGHMNRILTRPEYMNLAESDMYWSIDTTNEESYKLLDDMYSEFLPLFESPWVNVCSDEPYDLGKGKSAAEGKDVGELYFNHLLKIHDLAAKHGKKIMLFGDVVKEHPEYAEKMPKNIIYIDWIYDPKKEYKTPQLFENTGIPYWVSPGTGNWNTLFPRFDGSLTNILNLTLEGIDHGAQGMLLTDWNDHGGYTQASPTYYSYAYAAAVSWLGKEPEIEYVDRWIDGVLEVDGYSDIIHKLGSIYNIVPIWSKNRSQCVMGLFDEPIFGNTIRGPKPPEDLVPYDLTLPPGVEPVFERHSQHPLRPFFSIPENSKNRIRDILVSVEPMLERLKEGQIKSQLKYIVDAFNLMLDKLELGQKIIAEMEHEELKISDFLILEEELRIMIRRYIKLQMDYTSIWFSIARHSEIEISLIYFAHIISRLDYLKDWLSIQRENYNNEGVDWEFKTYNTGDYGTLPTY